jgi:hypothetical protein
MPPTQPTDEQLRQQIETAAAEHFPVDKIEDRIAVSLLANGRFQDELTATELAIILRNMVYTMFAQHKVGGRDLHLIHNIPSMRVRINKGRAKVKFIVHIHKPIVAFIRFQYTLINDPVSIQSNLRVKQGSLIINQDTRRFDLKAKAALAAIDIESMARKELNDPAAVITATLPSQLKKRGAVGKFTDMRLSLVDHHLQVYLEGEFERV